MRRWLLLLPLLLACTPPATLIPEPQAIPAPEVILPPDFQQAIAKGTRTTTGQPGPRYWQNGASYALRIRVDPDSMTLSGSSTIRYRNNSPDPLAVLVLDLAQNFHAPGAVRLEAAEVTGGTTLRRVVLDGQALQPGAIARAPGVYQVEGTKFVIRPAQPIAPGASTSLEVDWGFEIPHQGVGARMGHDRGNLIFLAYFYPQFSVYDDVVGWHPDPFLALGEFYSDFASYDVTIEVPAGWLVMGTGQLTNADQVLAPEIVRRLRAAEASDSVVHVVTAADFGSVTREQSGWQRWTFQADSVRDVAFSLTRESMWDAARSRAGGRPVRVDAIYRSTAPLWTESARYARHAVRFLSDFTGLAYPWSHMTVVEGGGIIGGGMEYPMMTLIGDYTAAGPDNLYDTTAHEIAHMWVPMIVSTDERRYGWIDEGITTFNEQESHLDFLPGTEVPSVRATGYLEAARAGEEGEIMRRSDFHYDAGQFVTATYDKPAAMLNTLRALLGEDVFLRAYRQFIDDWKWKHPYPWDLWNTFERVSGRDLGWFWQAWYETTGVLDQGIESVTPGSGGTTIVVRSYGQNPMPTVLTVTLANGSTTERTIPVERWFGGTERVTVTVPGVATRVEIDAGEDFPDVNRENNVWGS